MVSILISTATTAAAITAIIGAIVSRSKDGDFEIIVALGPLTVFAILSSAELTGSLFTLRYQRDMHRAFAARVGGWMLSAAIAWTILSGISLYSYQINFQSTFTYALIACGIAVIEITVWWLAGAASAAFLFVGVLFSVCISLLLFPVLASAPEASRATHLALAMMAALSGTFALAKLANVNRFSLHSLYKEGLVRTFLGASRLGPRNVGVCKPPTHSGPQPRVSEQVRIERENEAAQFVVRKANPVTDIDDDDDPRLHWIKGKPGREFPIFLLNAAVNGRSLTDHEGRVPRQWPFTFSQYYCGSPVAGIGYAPTENYAQTNFAHGLTLGTAMAVSGAAMSPTAGRTTHPLRALILGVLNARLGIWIGNPRFPEAVASDKPPLAGFTVLREILGLRSKFSRWIHLSDGGHFENLGLYELIRRGCRRIILVDATCDPNGEFSDLANAIRRVKIDLGVTIKRGKNWGEFQKDGQILATGESSHGGWTWLDVEFGEGLPRGRILYIKPSTRDTHKLEVEVRQYWKTSRAFPHEPTADQFFGEEQMEAYRALGEEICKEALSTVFAKKSDQSPDYDRDPRLVELLLRATKSKHSLYEANGVTP